MHLQRRHPRTRALSAAAVTAVSLLLPATHATAFVSDRTWIGASGGSWAVPTNWSPNGIPGSSENITIVGTTTAYSVVYNGSYSTNGPSTLILDASSAANSLTFTYNVTNNLYTSQQWVGRNFGHVTVSQPFGTNTVGGILTIGNGASLGTYSLSGTGITKAGEEYVGNTGSGTFVQTGGSHTIADPTVNNTSILHIGLNNGSTGLYSLSAGTLSTINMMVGDSGTGSFAQTGGTVTLTGTLSTGSNTLATTLFVGRNSTSTGSYTLSAGNVSTKNLTVGNSGTGTFTQSGGATTVSGALTIAATTGSSGTYSLSGTGSLAVATTASIGGTTSTAGGTGNLTISTGSASITGAVNVFTGSRLILTGGTLSAASLSLAGANAFDLSGGTFTARIATEPASTFRTDLSTGHIFSTAATADAQHRLAIGYVAGTTTLTARLTYLGDANLDGKINADDYALIDRGFAKHLTAGTALWTNGDFNYDGQVTSADYLLIDRVFTQQTGTLSPELLAERESQFGSDYVSNLISAVPEPTSLLAACGLVGFILPRRHRRLSTGNSPL